MSYSDEELAELQVALHHSFEACTGERKPKPKRTPDLEVKLLPRLQSGVATTEEAMKGWRGNKGRTNQAAAFLKRAKRSDARRKIEKATRKKMRRRK